MFIIFDVAALDAASHFAFCGAKIANNLRKKSKAEEFSIKNGGYVSQKNVILIIDCLRRG